MTITIDIECDGFGCDNAVIVEDSVESTIEETYWEVDPNDQKTHYCPDCWTDVKEELNHVSE